MNDKRSQTGLPAVNVLDLPPEELQGQPGSEPTAAEAFATTAQAIRGQTGRLSLRTILPAQMAHSRFVEQFPPDSRTRWVEIITELMVTAKDCVAENFPVEFYRKLRQIRETEEAGPVAEKLVFIPRLAAALSGVTFVYKNGTSTSGWKIEFCTSADLDGAAPSLLAKSDTGEIQRIPLIHIFAGLKIE